MTLPWLRDLRDNLLYFGKSYLVLLLALSLTAGAWYFSRLNHAAHHRQEVDKIAANISQSVQRQIDSYINVLEGVIGLYRASKSVERNEFHDYLTATRLADQHPGIKGVGFANLVPGIPQQLGKRNDSGGQPQRMMKYDNLCHGILAPLVWHHHRPRNRPWLPKAPGQCRDHAGRSVNVRFTGRHSDYG